ncbi:MAG: hypothetical protein ACXW1C_01425 [Gallionella sp.]
MKRNHPYKKIVASLCFALACNTSFAADSTLDLSVPASSAAPKSFMLASNEAMPAGVAPAAPQAEFSEPWMSGDKLHQYMGWTTLALVAATAFSAPGEGCEGAACANQPVQPRQTNGAHAKLAKAAAFMAAATVTSGLIDHWDDFHIEDGFTDPDNLHAILGTAGALMMMYAVNKSANSSVPVSHAGIAELGGVAMAVAVKLTW